MPDFSPSDFGPDFQNWPAPAVVLPSFPTLAGLSWPAKRSPRFSTIEHVSITGAATTQSPQPFPIYDYDLPYEFLRSDNATLELQALMSFYKARKGKALPFHFDDVDDDNVVAQAMGIGDGVTTNFGFVRTIGTDTEPVQDVSFAVVSVAGVEVLYGTDYTLLNTAQYGTVYGVHFLPGKVPTAGQPVTCAMSYNWLCRFSEDSNEFSKFMLLNGAGLWEAKSVKFHSQPQ